MNARPRPGSAADRADAPWKDRMTDALRYEKPRRLVYNGVLAVSAFRATWWRYRWVLLMTGLLTAAAFTRLVLAVLLG